MAGSTSRTQISLAIKALHYAYPPFVFLFFSVSVYVCKNRIRVQRTRQRTILGLYLAIITTYVCEGVVLLIRPVQQGYWAPQDRILYVLSATSVWSFLSWNAYKLKHAIRYPYWGSCFIAAASEITLMALSCLLIHPVNILEHGQLATQALRICFLILASFFPILIKRSRDDDPEHEALLPSRTDEPSTDLNQSLWELIKAVYKLWKSTLPTRKLGLMLNMVVIGICIFISRFLNVLVPRQLAIAVDELANPSKNTWQNIYLYFLYEWLASSSGIGAIQKIFWIPIYQYFYDAIGKIAHGHIMNLSYDFHSNKRSSELYSAVRRSREVATLFDTGLLAVPMAADLLVAVCYLSYRFGAYMVLNLVVVGVVYGIASAKFNATRLLLRRDLFDASDEEHQVLEESVGGWHTVSIFDRIPDEIDRYALAIENNSHRKWKCHLNEIRESCGLDFILKVGFALAAILVMRQTIHGHTANGSFNLLLAFWWQLGGSIGYFASLFGSISKNIVATEKLVKLLQLRPTVKDYDNAREFIFQGGEIRFKDVSFSYDCTRIILKEITFIAAPGKTTALVGESGSGKSTLLGLVFRFFDVQRGSLKIDEQDVRHVTLESLQKHIGVVPQEPALFNQTIADNIRYARKDATQQQIIEACKAAAIHSQIMSFPRGYDTVVGKNGVKLSGGEKQRIAIARAILKNSKIILLDEPTSNVDSQTEAEILQSLERLKKGRTTIVIAHRLSTIMNANLIVVIGDGGIIEMGTHMQLLRLKKKYYNLWKKQTSE